MNIYNFKNLGGISDIYTISTDCGIYDGYDSVTKECENGFYAERKNFVVKSKVENERGVSVRCDTVENTSNDCLEIRHYAYRFCIETGEVEVYTQLNHWQNESDGRWQDLVSGVTSMSKGAYTTSDATPMVAVWNKQTMRGIVFHIMPRHGWRIDVNKRNGVSGKIYTIIEISVCDDALCIKADKGESIEFSPVLYYEFKDKTSLDCHKLHQYIYEKYPRKEMPVVYNSWLATFDRIDFELMLRQAEEAAKLGCEYFVIDAGWFGEGDKPWTDLIGMWEENTTGALKGRMSDLSSLVHSLGMKFGIWLEPERALKDVTSVKEHPEYFFSNGNSYFFDYSKADARRYMLGVINALVEKYNVDYIKLDFNDNITYDVRREAFIYYHKGYFEFINDIRRMFPDIYIEGCGGGGFRLDLDKVRLFDSYWFTDNQSPIKGSRILKNTILRIPPAFIDRWVSVISIDGVTSAYSDKSENRVISTDNGTWDYVAGVNPEFLKAFFSGGNIGLTCDLTKWDNNLKKEMSEFIAKYKKEREFWKNAICCVICDTDSVMALQYENCGEIKIVVYTYKINQATLVIYPMNAENPVVIDEPKDYYGYIISME